MVDHDVDLLIVGGGLIGAMLMRALAPTGIRCLLVDTKSLADRADVDFDARSLALSEASVRILKMLNVWSKLVENAASIDSIHVSEQRRFGSAELHRQSDESLGYVVEIHHINEALSRLINKDQILAPSTLVAFDEESKIATVKTQSSLINIRARLIVAADGSDSSMRRLCNLDCHVKDYKQLALVTNIGIASPHQNIAYERFTPSGPLALLPMSNSRVSLVWSLPPNEATQLQNAAEEDFLRKLHEAFGYRLGRFVKVGRRVVYPLRQVTMPNQIKGSVAFIGNAAHTLHPVAGQGFNLGLRDVAMMAQCIIQYGLGHDTLMHYQKARLYDQTAITKFTDSLIGLFSSRLPGVSLARSLGLVALDNNSLLKKTLARYARGFAGVTPDLVCGIPIGTEAL